MNDKPSPLEGLKVVELARILAGPWMGQTLADLGAEVIKIESAAGDDTRTWGPPFVAHADGSGWDAAYFHSCNRGKQSVLADFNDARDLAMVQALIRRADVLVENFRVGGLARFGLDYASVSKLNPGLVYCSITGFGQDGPYARRAGYDAIIQAMSGLMSITGEADGAPVKVGVAIADILAGLYGVIGVQAALAHKQRTGLGQQIDISLMDCMVAALANQNLNYLVSAQSPGRMGTAHPNIVPYQVFAVADGHIMLAVGNDAQFVRLCNVLGQAALAENPDFATNAERVRHRDRLLALLNEAFTQWQRSDLLARLEQRGVPAGPVNSLAEAFADPQVRHRQLQLDLPAPYLEAGRVPGVRTPIRFSGADLDLSRSAPALGQHTEKVREQQDFPD